jgi:pyrroloquinoline-quinone synthase
VEFFDRLYAVSDRWNVLRHPFYTRWSEGGLSREDLALYAAEYRHLVVALAKTASRAADPEHAAEEASHVGLWDSFAAAVGPGGGGPLTETVACVETWTSDDPLEGLAVLYAVESAQPEISRVKLEGLLQHYGLEEGPATEYFALHAKLDDEHAARSRSRLEEELPAADADRLLQVAEAALRGNWRMLDGVERAVTAGT